MPITDAVAVLAELRSRYPGIEIRDYAFGRLYSTEHMMFFDCDGESEKSLTDSLSRVDDPALRALQAQRM